MEGCVDFWMDLIDFWIDEGRKKERKTGLPACGGTTYSLGPRRWRGYQMNKERKTGLEPATYSLGSCRSTT